VAGVGYFSCKLKDTYIIYCISSRQLFDQLQPRSAHQELECGLDQSYSLQRFPEGGARLR